MRGAAHTEGCRDRVQNKITTDPDKADRYETPETRRLDLKSTVQGGVSTVSSPVAAQSSSPGAAPSDQLPSRGVVETARESCLRQTGGDEMVDDRPSRKRPTES